MQIDKDTVLDFLRQRGREDQVEQARNELPDSVDPVRDGGVLSRFGIDVGELLAMVPESLTDKLPPSITGKLGGLLGK